ncbi:MAG: DNA polymerase III subunit alpha [Gemmatimonadota bacterium]|nr:DNA polymerase III subunit alpha [Gemmatimonadota bacterium]
MSFVHLHCHSEYSLLDGANRIDALLDRAVELDMQALAITDHGNLHGAWEFQEKARKLGLKPLLGFEAYVSYGDRRRKERPPDAPADYTHLVVLAANRAGYHNLVRLCSRGFTEGFYRKPRIDRSLLAELSDGLVITSACLASEISRSLLRDRYDEAKETAEWYARTFPGRYFLEVQDHGIADQHKVNEGVFQLADELGLPVVLTNDAHYMRREDADAHDTLLCIGTGTFKDDPDRLSFFGQESYFKSAAEMAELFPNRSDLLENTLRVADLCDVQFEQKYHLPNFPLPEEHSSDSAYLRGLTESGARERYGDPLPDDVRERLEYELGVIEQTGYAGYLLIVWDVIRAAREMDIPVGPGRGSAASSIICYCLRITDVDPLEFDLLFERFLNPDRVSMPDIDIDFCYEGRGRVIEYVREKYGADSVGQIITFGTMLARAAIRDVGRVQGFTPQETDRLAKLIPNSPGYSLTAEEAINKVQELADLHRKDPRIRQLLDETARIEGLKRHTSVHAAGVVIAPGPLEEFVPVCRDTRNGDDSVITQFDMIALEKAGMLKIDFLGLRTLTVIHDAMQMIAERHEVDVDWRAIGHEDPAVYEMLAAGGTSGVFQFESPLATDKLRAMRCDRFSDLVAVSALIRPGPLDAGMTDVYIRRKRGFEPVTYPTEELAELLEPTYGIITYQEQVMRVANLLAGFTLAEADVLRKAVGKKDAELTNKVLSDFKSRAVARGLTSVKATEIAELIRTFGRYGFNKAHSVAYGVISYQTAWLKAHFPAEFMAALLSSIIDNTDKVVSYIAAARSMGIEILPPSVTESGYKFTVVSDKQVRFGLGAIKGVGASAIRSILDARRDGPFTSMFDFCQRIDLRLNNKRVLECMIAAGALDTFGERAALCAGLETALSEAGARQRELETGQESLFGAVADVPRPTPRLPVVAPWTEQERLKEEKAVLGFYISGHPLDRHRDLVELLAMEANTGSLGRLRDRKVQLASVVTSMDVRVSRKTGKEWCRLTLEDYHGTADALVFGDVWATTRDLFAEDLPVLIEGTVSGNSRDEEDPPIFVDSVLRLKDLGASGQIGVCIELTQGEHVPDGEFARVRKALEAAPGPGVVLLRWRPAGGNGGNGSTDTEPPVLKSRLRVEPSARLLADLRTLVGGDRVHLTRG